MKFLLPGLPHQSLATGLGELGHEVYYRRDTDWYSCMAHYNERPEQWADKCAKAILKEKPDVFMLTKGLMPRENGLWCVPDKFLWWVRQRVKCMVFLSFDCPASTPLYLINNILPPFDLFGTTCVGISKLFARDLPKKLKIFEFWLAFDQNLPKTVEKKPEFACDFVITGTPYYKPFEKPHYRSGFGFPRRDLVQLIRRQNPGVKIHLYGPDIWLDPHKGGDSSFKDIYKGWVRPNDIHLVHRAAKVTLGTQLVQGYRYESGRCVWTGGAGGFLLHEDRPGLRDEFGRNVLWFNTGDLNHAHKQLIMALNRDEMRESMSGGLHKHVWAKHTWKHRAETLVKEVEPFVR